MVIYVSTEILLRAMALVRAGSEDCALAPPKTSTSIESNRIGLGLFGNLAFSSTYLFKKRVRDCCVVGDADVGWYTTREYLGHSRTYNN